MTFIVWTSTQTVFAKTLASKLKILRDLSKISQIRRLIRPSQALLRPLYKALFTASKFFKTPKVTEIWYIGLISVFYNKNIVNDRNSKFGRGCQILVTHIFFKKGY